MMKTNTKVITLVGVLAAMSAVLMIFPSFPILPTAPWLEVDFSDVPALLVSTALSPLLGFLVVVVKNVVHLAFTSSGGIGELSNLIIGSSFVIAAGLFSKYIMPNVLMKKKLLLILPIASVVQVIAASLCNYYIMCPMYGIPEPMIYVVGSVIPFNLIKDVIVCVTFWLVYAYIYPHIKKNLY